MCGYFVSPNILRFGVRRGVHMELDRKDFALIEALQQNASQRLEDLAKLINLAPSSVHDRLRRLQREGIIRRWTVKVDAPRLGLGVMAFVGLTLSKTCSELEIGRASCRERV